MNSIIIHSDKKDSILAASIFKYGSYLNRKYNFLKLDSTEVSNITNTSYLKKYKEPLPNTSQYGRIILCGVDFKKEEVDLIINQNKFLVWIDNRKSYIKKYDYLKQHYKHWNIYCTTGTDITLSQLVWKALFHESISLEEILKKELNIDE